MAAEWGSSGRGVGVNVGVGIGVSVGTRVAVSVGAKVAVSVAVGTSVGMGGAVAVKAMATPDAAGITSRWPMCIRLGFLMLLACWMSSTETPYLLAIRASVSPVCTTCSTRTGAGVSVGAMVGMGVLVGDAANAAVGVGVSLGVAAGTLVGVE